MRTGVVLGPEATLQQEGDIFTAHLANGQQVLLVQCLPSFVLDHAASSEGSDRTPARFPEPQRDVAGLLPCL